MGPIVVVILDPLLGNLSDLFEIREEVDVQDFVSVSSIESLDSRPQQIWNMKTLAQTYQLWKLAACPLQKRLGHYQLPHLSLLKERKPVLSSDCQSRGAHAYHYVKMLQRSTLFGRMRDSPSR